MRKGAKAQPDSSNPSPTTINTFPEVPSTPTPQSSQLPSTDDIEVQNPQDAPCTPCFATPQTPNGDEPIEIHHEVGHDGHMVAAMYNQQAADARALIRMGIFAGIALAFHVRSRCHKGATASTLVGMQFKSITN